MSTPLPPELIKFIDPLIKELNQGGLKPQNFSTKLFHALDVEAHRDKTFRQGFSPDMFTTLSDIFKKEIKKEDHKNFVNIALMRFALSLPGRGEFAELFLKHLVDQKKSREMELRKKIAHIRVEEEEERLEADDQEEDIHKKKFQEEQADYQKLQAKLEQESKEVLEYSSNLTQNICGAFGTMTEVLKLKIDPDFMKEQQDKLQGSFQALENNARQGGPVTDEMRKHLTNAFESLDAMYNKVKESLEKDNRAAHEVLDNWASKVKDNLTQWLDGRKVEPYNQKLNNDLIAQWNNVLSPAAQQANPQAPAQGINPVPPQGGPQNPQHPQNQQNQQNQPAEMRLRDIAVDPNKNPSSPQPDTAPENAPSPARTSPFSTAIPKKPPPP